VTFLAATALAGVSGYFSVAGMSTLFAGAATAAVVMGGALEFAKLVGASWLSRSWSTAFPPLRWAILAMVVALMGAERREATSAVSCGVARGHTALDASWPRRRPDSAGVRPAFPRFWPRLRGRPNVYW
jgi:hypothetical protein